MNEHLRPVFEQILPALEKSNIKYWVYGGVAVAGLKREWIRDNEDVDLAVMENDYEQAVSVLVDLAQSKKWKFNHRPPLHGIRPKLNLYPDPHIKEQCSIIPLYKEGDKIKFVFGFQKSLPDDVLEGGELRIENYSFNAIKTEYIKILLKHYLENQSDLKKSNKKYKDAEAILTKEEVVHFFPNS